MGLVVQKSLGAHRRAAGRAEATILLDELRYLGPEGFGLSIDPGQAFARIGASARQIGDVLQDVLCRRGIFKVRQCAWQSL